MPADPLPHGRGPAWQQPAVPPPPGNGDIRYQMFAPPYHLTWSMSASPSTSLPASTRTRSVAASCAAVRPYTR